ncbi:transposase family protein [Streptomyces griseus]|uniref:helix-turn-helix domain-containing protein n=1 Tax=Streptomyces griseus TaxID=1911 RepID=UPI0033E5A101
MRERLQGALRPRGRPCSTTPTDQRISRQPLIRTCSATGSVASATTPRIDPTGLTNSCTDSGWWDGERCIADHGRVVGNVTRTAIICDRRVAVLSADVIAEFGPLRLERHQARVAFRPRKRAVGNGAEHRLVFVDRLLTTLVHLRQGVTHDVLACWFGVDRSTVTPAVGEVRPLLAERGGTLQPRRAAANPRRGIGHLGETGKTGIIDITERRGHPAVGLKDRLQQEQADRREGHGPHRRSGEAAVLQPDQNRKLRGHHPDPRVRAGQALG